MNMRRADKTLIVLAVCLLALSCATGCKVDPGADVILVNAERGQALSLDTVEALWHIDYDNLDTMRQVLPDVHRWVEESRRDFPGDYRKAQDAIAVYRAARTVANENAMNSALEKIEQAAAVARRYIVQAHEKGLKAKPRSKP
jgi:hypothetical protein